MRSPRSVQQLYKRGPDPNPWSVVFRRRAPLLQEKPNEAIRPAETVPDWPHATPWRPTRRLHCSKRTDAALANQALAVARLDVFSFLSYLPAYDGKGGLATIYERVTSENDQQLTIYGVTVADPTAH
jgi:hypothetical protein